MQTAAVRVIAWLGVSMMSFGVRDAAGADAPAKLKTQTVRIKLAPENVRWDWAGRPEVPIDLVQLPPGKITLKGADGKDEEHQVKPVWIAKYETRWDEYFVFAFALDLPDRERTEQRRNENHWRATRPGPAFTPPQRWEPDLGAGYPADNIQFPAALKYCAWLSKHTGKKFRLPTEAEWEYACRAGGPPLKPDAKALDAVAWFGDNSGEEPHPVGQKRPNAWGLYDMLGNVGEFVIRDPKDDKGLLAGGSYKDKVENVHSGTREPYSPAWQKNDYEEPKRADWLDYDSAHHVGFRVVMED